MAAVTHGVSVSDTTNTTSYASASFTPAANDLLVLLVSASDTVDAGAVIDDQSLGWTKITTAVKSASVDTMYLFVANALAAASAMTVTFQCSGDTATGCNFEVLRVSGMTKTGATAVLQSAVLSNNGGTPAPAFGAAVQTGNPTIGAVGNSNNPAAITEPTGWTEQIDVGYATPSKGLEVVSRDSGFTGTTITWGSAGGASHGVIIAELDTGSGGTTAVSATGPFVLESTQSLLASGLVPINSSQGITSTGVLPINNSQGIDVTGSLPVYSGQGVSGIGVVPINASQGVQNTAQAVLETLSGLTATDVMILDATSTTTAVSQTGVLNLDMAKAVGQTVLLFVNTAQQVVAVATLPLESQAAPGVSAPGTVVLTEPASTVVVTDASGMTVVIRDGL